MKNEKVKKIINILGNVLMFVFLAFCIFAVIVTVAGKKEVDGATEIFGYQLRIVTSDSMAKSEYTDVSNFEIKSIPINSMVFVKTVPDGKAEANDWYKNIKVGDVLTFRYVYTNQVTITHRVSEITEKADGSGYIIKLVGDNKLSNSQLLEQEIDTSIDGSYNYVIGKVVGQSKLLGFFLTLLKKPVGTICIVIIPCFIIILLEVLKIISAFNADKKKREKEENEKKDNELEELRRRLAALENANAPKEDSNEEK